MMSEKSCDNCKHNVMFGMCEISGERVPYDEMPCDGDDWENECLIFHEKLSKDKRGISDE